MQGFYRLALIAGVAAFVGYADVMLQKGRIQDFDLIATRLLDLL
jgi:hypothetical protein